MLRFIAFILLFTLGCCRLCVQYHGGFGSRYCTDGILHRLLYSLSIHDVETSSSKQNVTFRIKKRSNRAITTIFHNISLQKKGMFSQLENMPFSFTSFFMHSFLLEHRIQPASKLSDFINHLFLLDNRRKQTLSL